MRLVRYLLAIANGGLQPRSALGGHFQWRVRSKDQRYAGSPEEPILAAVGAPLTPAKRGGEECTGNALLGAHTGCAESQISHQGVLAGHFSLTKQRSLGGTQHTVLSEQRRSQASSTYSRRVRLPDAAAAQWAFT